MRGIGLREVYQFYNMCPKTLPIRKPIIKKKDKKIYCNDLYNRRWTEQLKSKERLSLSPKLKR